MDTHAYAAVISGRLYAYGQGSEPQAARSAAQVAFLHQLDGATTAMACHMWDKVRFVPLDPDAASETAECIDAEPLGWE